MEKKRETLKILTDVMEGKKALNKAQRELFVLFGEAKSITCKLDRYPSECAIAINTTPVGKKYNGVLSLCNGCGHLY